MRWHKDKRCETEGILRHPADAEDARNVRLTLSSDGFNPFGNMSLSYSMWSVMLIPYNLPPWKCMKESSIFLSLLIPGPRSPGTEIDVYLQPLIDELNELWVNGIRTYDSFNGSFFQLHAALLWTINDFPAYGDLSGWRTKRYKACPVCNDDSSSMRLKSKICFMGHRRYLPQTHTWRRSKQHDGKQEFRLAPKMLTGQDIINQLNSSSFPTLSKHPTIVSDNKRKRLANKHNWSKRSIFFDLPYWKNLMLHHKLDVMHIEKNICDNLVGIILNIDGKTKDTIKAREDLVNLKIRKELHIQEIGGRRVKPHASFTLTTSEKVSFCTFLKSVKFPDGFASNISQCVNANEGRITGLKSHDCHVLLQRLLPIGIRPYIPKDIATTISELSNFFHDLCAKTLRISELERMQTDIVFILCKLEKIFPPAFFDVMVHLAVHLSWEATIIGPVGYSWMYPIERSLRYLKQYVRNKARPKGSIAEAYIINESLTFCSMYLHGIETRFNRIERNYDNVEDVENNNELSVFSGRVRLLGGSQFKRLTSDGLKKAHWYILNNCDEVAPYLEYVSILVQH
ncbi:uncharacterized protein LOC111021544 [Momordica charantia]|uniref:Uncharacterized protein LOC111021544 n=1 Tax=Momordica charantia TaxID=3673 RepID=A0A6J1DN59_MOMCH|nr:uncharacterized protein LOC111021544 [Momordica charantia]